MKIRVENYSFNAALKQVTFTDYTPVLLDSILLIVNVTDNVVLYNFADPTKGGTVATNILTLEHDTTSMSDSDDLLIYYDDPDITTDFATQTTLAAIKTKTDNLDTALSGIKTGTDKIIAAPATSALQTTGNTSLSSIDTKTPALGQALAAASTPVVLTAAQVATLTPPAAITGFATETTLGTRLTESDFDTKTGSLTETAPATDTASSGLNGRLQRIAQRITSLIALLPTSLGQKTMANSLGVTISSDQTAVPTSLASVPSHAVTNAGVFVTQENGAALTSMQLLDDIVYTDDTSTHATGTSKGALLMAAATPTDTAVNANDIGAVAMTLNRELMVSPTTAIPAGNNNIGDVDVLTVPADPFGATADAAVSAGATGSISAKLRSISRDLVANIVLAAGANAIGKLAANAGVTIGAVEIAASQTLATVTNVATIGTSITPGVGAANLGKREDDAHTSLDTGVMSLGVRRDTAAASSGTTGDYEPFSTDALGKMWTADSQVEDAVHGSGDRGSFALSVANEAQTSLAADGDYIGQATDIKGNRLTVGNIAHDGVDAGNPVKVGGKAVNAEPAAVAASDRTNFITDLVGKQIVAPYSNPENIVSGAITTPMTGTTSTSLVAAPASGLRNYITTIIVSNAHATVGTDIAIQDGSGGTTLLTIPAAAVYGGAVITLPVPLRQPSTATALYCANVTTGASTKVSAVGYKGI